MTDHLFVYGTLRSEGGAPGGVSVLLEERAEKVGGGEIVGRLYEAGSYPAAVPEDDGASVTAWVYFYNRDASSLSEIRSGDYLDARETADGGAG